MSPPTRASAGRTKRIRRDSPEAREELRTRIVLAAFHTFQAHGEAAVTMRTVAQQVGVSQMALYGYFENRAHLLRSMWEFLFAELRDHLCRAATSRRSHRARLASLIDCWITYWQSNPNNYRLVYIAGYDVPLDEQSKHFEQWAPYREVYALLIDTLTGFAKEQSLPVTRVKLALDVLLCFCLGYLHATMTVGRHPWSDRKVLRRTVIESALEVATNVLSGKRAKAEDPG